MNHLKAQPPPPQKSYMNMECNVLECINDVFLCSRHGGFIRLLLEEFWRVNQRQQSLPLQYLAMSLIRVEVVARSLMAVGRFLSRLTSSVWILSNMVTDKRRWHTHTSVSTEGGDNLLDFLLEWMYVRAQSDKKKPAYLWGWCYICGRWRRSWENEDVSNQRPLKA